MEEKKKLSNVLQVLLGIIIGAVMYGLYYSTFPIMDTITGYLLVLALSIVIIFGTVKLIKTVTYKAMGITTLIVVTPILLFSLLAGTCVTFFLY